MEAGPHRYWNLEEVLNSVTHGVGLALSVAGMVVLVVIAINPLLRSVPDLGLLFLLLGGLAYSLGCFFYLRDTKPFRHVVWHLFVLAGSVFHYLAIAGIVLPATA